MGRFLQLWLHLSYYLTSELLTRPDISLSLVFTLSLGYFRFAICNLRLFVGNSVNRKTIANRKFLCFFFLADLFDNDRQVTRHGVDNRNDALGLRVYNKHQF